MTRKKMFGNVWAVSGVWGMFWGDVTGQNVCGMFRDGVPLECRQEKQKIASVPYASLHIVERLCDVALNGCRRSFRSLVTGGTSQWYPRAFAPYRAFLWPGAQSCVFGLRRGVASFARFTVLSRYNFVLVPNAQLDCDLERYEFPRCQHCHGDSCDCHRGHCPFRRSNCHLASSFYDSRASPFAVR